MAMRLLMLVMASMATRLPAQQLTPDDVPLIVRHAWAATHQGAVIWHAGPGRTFEAWFTARDLTTRVHYTSTGALVETDVEIGAITMPGAVRAAVVRALRGVQLSESWRVDLAGGGTLYQVNGWQGTRSVTARFGANGQLISRQVMPESP
ncbi:MAG TPA: hypothetical protein VGM77_05665 [Gemmatimonadales bacterium]